MVNLLILDVLFGGLDVFTIFKPSLDDLEFETSLSFQSPFLYGAIMNIEIEHSRERKLHFLLFK